MLEDDLNQKLNGNPFLSPSNHPSNLVNGLLDRLWVLALLAMLVTGSLMFRSGRYCAYFGTDFRGYYAAAQIVRELGFDKVYDQAVQVEYQSSLLMKCPGTGAVAPPLQVYMPYMPIYMLVILPLTYLDFTTSYALWSLVNMVGLIAYLHYFLIAAGSSISLKLILQWIVCVPVLSNLALGQMNVLLVICLGEFVLAFIHGRFLRSGVWLGVMLIKPHTLILILPGLIIGRKNRTLVGFGLGTLAVLVSSVLVSGLAGVTNSIQLAVQFAGPLIQTAASMMNFRALALNLGLVWPAWLAWAIAICGMVLSSGLVIYLWRRDAYVSRESIILLILATFTATFAVSWHSHFYLQMLLLPLLLFLDSKSILPQSGRWVWIVGPPLLYLLLILINPATAREGFGLGMLALSLGLLVWAANLIISERIKTRGITP
jgi:hypothetical protein